MENVLTTAEMEVKIQDLPVIKPWGQVPPTLNPWRNCPMKQQDWEQGL